MTRTITIDPEQYKQLLEHSQRSGQSVKDAINEALQDFVASSEKARESQGQQERGQKMANEDRTVVVDADQYARLKPYLDIKGVSLASVINEVLER